MTRGEKLLRNHQRNRAHELNLYLENKCSGRAYENGILRVNVIADWLKREYRLGKAAAKRQKKAA